MLTPADTAFLTELGLPFSATEEGGWTVVVISGWPLPPGYSLTSVELLLRISAGYPDIPLDMWYFAPAVALAGGGEVPQTQVTEIILERPWQRWSRHLDPGDWQPGVDNVQTYLARVRADLRQWVIEQAA